MVGERSLADMEQGGEVRVPTKDISEPSFGFGRGGDREFVLPGNREFVPGDRIPRPQGGGGGGGQRRRRRARARTTFVFSLSREEFMQIFFDDLELPSLARTELGAHRAAQEHARRLHARPACRPISRVVRTLRRRWRAGSRSAAASRARLRWRWSADFAVARGGRRMRGREAARDSHARARAAGRGGAARLPFLDELDLRYRNRVWRPEPIARAVMFCLMDVSASMDEDKKDLAKRFFTLLYLFLTRKYERVELVFIRHTDDAEEVDEETFFHDTRSGGTVVYSALELDATRSAPSAIATRLEHLRARRPPTATRSAPTRRAARGFLREQLLPADALLRLHGSSPTARALDRRRCGPSTSASSDRATSRCARSRAREIYPVFRELFARESTI